MAGIRDKTHLFRRVKTRGLYEDLPPAIHQPEPMEVDSISELEPLYVAMHRPPSKEEHPPLQQRKNEATEKMHQIDKALSSIFDTPTQLPTSSGELSSGSPSAGRQETARPACSPPATQARHTTVSATASNLGKQVQFYKKLVIFFLCLLHFQLSYACIKKPANSMQPCKLTLNHDNINKAKADIGNLVNQVSALKMSPVETPNGDIDDRIIKFMKFSTVAGIATAKSTCNKIGEVFSPSSEYEIANILELTNSSVLLHIEKKNTRYFLSKTHIHAPSSTHAVPDQSKYIILTKKEKIDVLYIDDTSTLDSTLTYVIPCAFDPNDAAAELTLTSLQTDMIFKTNSVLDAIQNLVEQYKQTDLVKEDNCLPIDFLPYTSESKIPTFKKYVTPKTKDDIFQKINLTSSILEKLEQKAKTLLESRFSIHKTQGKIQDIIINFNISLIEHLIILILLSTSAFLAILLLCSLGVCRYCQGKTARHILQRSEATRIPTSP